MRTIIIGIWISISVLTMQEHKTPEGTFCTPAGVTIAGGQVVDPSHPCHCQHMTHSKDCEGYVEENVKCSNYCSKGKCKCPVICKDPVPLGDPDDQ